MFDVALIIHKALCVLGIGAMSKLRPPGAADLSKEWLERCSYFPSLAKEKLSDFWSRKLRLGHYDRIGTLLRPPKKFLTQILALGKLLSPLSLNTYFFPTVVRMLFWYCGLSLCNQEFRFFFSGFFSQETYGRFNATPYWRTSILARLCWHVSHVSRHLIEVHSPC